MCSPNRIKLWTELNKRSAAAAAKSLQLCPTLCDTTDGSPPRLLHPWDSPGKNTGVGCHFLLQCMKVKSESEVTQSCLTLSDPMDRSLPGSSVHGIFPGKRTGVGCHCLIRCVSYYCANQNNYRLIPGCSYELFLSDGCLVVY